MEKKRADLQLQSLAHDLIDSYANCPRVILKAQARAFVA